MGAGLGCVDLFCGAGGFSLGFQRAGFDILAALDRSPAAIETYRHNFPEVGKSAMKADIRKIDSNQFLEQAEIAPNEVDVVIGGPPCKGFSHAGKMDEEDPRNALLSNYISLVEQLEPEAIVMENVMGMLNLYGGKYKNRVLAGLNEAGYEVDSPVLLNAADFGVPQRRKRVFFMGSRHGEINPPSPTHFDPESGSPMSDSSREPYVPVEDAICDLSFLGVGEKSNRYELVAASEYQREMRKKAEALANHKSTNHSNRVRERFSIMSWGDTMDDLPEEYRTAKHTMIRWHPDKVAPTVTCLPDDFVHYSRDRIPTVRENARLQSFPDDFDFKGTRTTGGKKRRWAVPQYTQVGNAVPPKLAKTIASKTREVLDAPSTRALES